MNFILTFVLLFLSSCQHDKLQQVWEVSGLSNPESVVYDSSNHVYYVSNVAGNVGEKDGLGFISRISEDRKTISIKWVGGMNAPKGLGLTQGHLFVADIDTVVEIDVASAQIIKTYPITGAKFLNDIAVSKTGDVYVSDMMDNAIYKISQGVSSLVIKTDALEFPNGLFWENDNLIIATWGVPTDGFKTKVPGHLKTLHLSSNQLESLGSGAPVGNLDGIEADGRGNYFATDWISGQFRLINKEGSSRLLATLNSGSADLTFVAENNLIIIPFMNDGKLVGYSLGK